MSESVATAVPLRALGRLRWFVLWLCAFYAAWLAVVVAGDHLGTLAAHWPIALAMAAGSYVAGSTPMGGGTVGFPILVLLFDLSATLGRDFGFAIQSVGMTSASIFILCSGSPIEWRLLRWAMLGSVLATPLGVAFLAPQVNDLGAKLLFSVAWAAFGLMHLIRLREVCGFSGITCMPAAFDRRAGLAIGVVGGAGIAAITGVGIDLLLYVVLVLLSRADLKIAIPTSVLIMTWTSLVGTATVGVLSQVDPEGSRWSAGLFGYWLTAAPVVAVGAPLGAFVVERIGRQATLRVVAVLCAGQFLWTLWHEREGLGPMGAALAVAGLLLFSAAFHAMYEVGKRSAQRRGHSDLPPG